MDLSFRRLFSCFVASNTDKTCLVWSSLVSCHGSGSIDGKGQKREGKENGMENGDGREEWHDEL